MRDLIYEEVVRHDLTLVHDEGSIRTHHPLLHVCHQTRAEIQDTLSQSIPVTTANYRQRIHGIYLLRKTLPRLEILKQYPDTTFNVRLDVMTHVGPKVLQCKGTKGELPSRRVRSLVRQVDENGLSWFARMGVGVLVIYLIFSVCGDIGKLLLKI